MKRRTGACFHHVYIKGLEDNLIYRDRGDFISGMNYVALCTFCCGVSLLAFTLMSNHFHFIIYGTPEEAKKFIDLYKYHMSRYSSRKYGVSHLLRRVGTGYRPIENSNDALRTAIAYVVRNHISAGINQSVQGYEWSSGYCYFAGTDLLEGSVSVSSIGIRKYRNIMHTKTKLDSSYKINSKGYIEPASYVCIDFVESCFGRVQSLDYYIYKAGSARSKEGPVDFSDEFVITGLKEILDKKYGAEWIDAIDEKSKRDVLLMVRRQFNCSPKQLARTMQMSIKEVTSMLTIDI